MRHVYFIAYGNMSVSQTHLLRLAKTVVMFIHETLYDDAFKKNIFTGATPHTSITVRLKFFY